MGYSINIFLFPELSPSAGSEADLMVRRWDAILEGDAITTLSNMILMLAKK